MIPGVDSANVQKKMDELFSAILLEQQQFDSIRPPKPELKDKMAKALEEYVGLRGLSLFFNYYATGRGHGPFAELLDGSVKYDLICGIGPALLGHSHPLAIKSNLEAAASDVVMCGNLQSYPQPHELTRAIVETVPASKLKHFWFSCSGSFANDVALKMIWQKKQPRYGIIAFEKCFTGRSVATQDITYTAAYREGMPKLLNVKWVPHYDYKNPANATKKTIDALNKVWDEQPDAFGALTIEIVQGEAGFMFGTRDWYKSIFDWAKTKGLYIWIDEVQSFGRTKELFAFQMFGLDEYVDICTIGKVFQACGTLYSDELKPKPGLIAGTFNGSLAAINMGTKTINYLKKGNFYGKGGRIESLEGTFKKKFENLIHGGCKGKITSVSTIGTMVAFEIGDSSKEISTTFVKKLLDNGVVSFIAGSNPTRIRFLLPLCLTDQHIDEIFTLVEKTVHEVVK